MKKTMIFCGFSIFYVVCIFFLYQELGRQVSLKNPLNDDLKIKSSRDVKIQDDESIKTKVNKKDVKLIANEDIKINVKNINVKNILPVWKDAIADISKATKVPIFIPSMMPTPSIDTNRQIFGYSSSNKDSYTIYLGFYNPCPMTRNCVFFSITGELITDKTQSGLLKYQTEAHRYKESQERNCQEYSVCRPWGRDNGGEIILAKEIKGVYIGSISVWH
jgi:hypothetical protein